MREGTKVGHYGEAWSTICDKVGGKHSLSDRAASYVQAGTMHRRPPILQGTDHRISAPPG